MALLSAISMPHSHGHHTNKIVKSQTVSQNRQSSGNKSLKLEQSYSGFYSNLRVESSLYQPPKSPSKEERHHDTSFLPTPPNDTKVSPDLVSEECPSYPAHLDNAKSCLVPSPSRVDSITHIDEQDLSNGQKSSDHHVCIHQNLDHAQHINTLPVENRSRLTNILLLSTPRWPLIHTIISEKDSRRIFYFMSLNFCFMLVQAFYGYQTDSLGLLSDSIHMFFDCLAIGVGLFASIARKWPPSSKFPFGFEKIESLSGFGNGVSLILISIEIMIEAIERFIERRETKRLGELFTVSSLGLAVNLIGMACFEHHGHAGHDCAGHGHLPGHNIPDSEIISSDKPISQNCNLNTHCQIGSSYDKNIDTMHENTDTSTRTHQSSQTGSLNTYTHSHKPHSHSHSHSHDTHSHNNTHSHKDDNMHGIFLHVLADTMGSAAVLLSTTLIYFTGFNGWDPVASCVIASLIFFSSIPLIKSSAKKLLLTISDDREYTLRDTLSRISELRGVVRYYAPRFWLIDRTSESQKEMITGVVHIVATRGSDLDELRQRVEEFLKTYNVDAVVQVERELGPGYQYT